MCEVGGTRRPRSLLDASNIRARASEKRPNNSACCLRAVEGQRPQNNESRLSAQDLRKEQSPTLLILIYTVTSAAIYTL